MNQNPLYDIVEQVKQQKLESELKDIKNAVQALLKERKTMAKLIELEVYQTVGNNTSTKKMSINPEYITFIEEKDSNAIVHMSNDAVLHTVESRTDIIKLIDDSTPLTYIK